MLLLVHHVRAMITSTNIRCDRIACGEFEDGWLSPVPAQKDLVHVGLSKQGSLNAWGYYKSKKYVYQETSFLNSLLSLQASPPWRSWPKNPQKLKWQNFSNLLSQVKLGHLSFMYRTGWPKTVNNHASFDQIVKSVLNRRYMIFPYFCTEI